MSDHDSLLGTLRLIRSDYARSLDHYSVKPSIGRVIGMSILPPIVALVIYRWSHYFHRKGLGFLAWPLYSFNIFLCGFDVPPRTEIGPRCLLGHPSGQIISGKIGKNSTLLARVGIGSRSTFDDIGGGPGLPVLEDDVTVGCGAQIQGPIRIGAGAVIGAMTLVMRDVPPGTTLVGNPARVLRTSSTGDATPEPTAVDIAPSDESPRPLETA